MSGSWAACVCGAWVSVIHDSGMILGSEFPPAVQSLECPTLWEAVLHGLGQQFQVGQRPVPAASQDERRVANGAQDLAWSLQRFSLLYLDQSSDFCLETQRAIQRRSFVEFAGEQVRRGQIQRRSLDEVCVLNPAGCLAGSVYIHPGIQGGPGQIGVPNSDWSIFWGTVSAVGARRSGVLLIDRPIPGRFPASGNAEISLAVDLGRVAEPASGNAELSFAVDLGRVAEPVPWNAEFLLAVWDPVPVFQDAELSLVEDPGCFSLCRRGRNLLGSLREASCGGVFS